MVTNFVSLNFKNQLFIGNYKVKNYSLFLKSINYYETEKHVFKQLSGNSNFNHIYNRNINYLKHIPSKIEKKNNNFSEVMNLLNNFCSKSSNDSTQSNKKIMIKLSDSLHKMLNKQILEEMKAGYTYYSMATYFARTEVALPGCFVFYKKMYREEFSHADKLINYLTMRGGKVLLSPIQPPSNQEWGGIAKTLKDSIKLESYIKKQLEKLYNQAEKEGDFGLSDLIQSEYIREQDESINELSRLLVRHHKMCKHDCGCGEFLFDRELFGIFGKIESKNNENSQGHETPQNAYL